MSRLKEIISAVLLLIITSIPCLLFVYYQSAQWKVQLEMEEKLEMEHLQTIYIPIKDIKWNRENKEIIVGERLFDVKSVIYKDSVAIFSGLYDYQETHIKEQLAIIEEQEEENSKTESANNLISVLLFKEEDSGYASMFSNFCSIQYLDFNN